MSKKNFSDTVSLEYIDIKDSAEQENAPAESRTLRKLREQRELEELQRQEHSNADRGGKKKDLRRIIRGTENTVELTLKDLPFQANEAINTLRGNIQLSGYNLKVIGITSALKHEGKSSLSFQLAKSFAGLGKRTLYVDCDIRNSHTMTRYKVRGKVTGLSAYLCGNAELEDILYTTNVEDLDVVFTGDNAPNPSELFSGSRFKEMIAMLRSLYDYVIVDTPPVNEVIDGVLILNECDGTVLVVESGVTERGNARKAQQQLEYAGIKILGAVLNKIGTKKSGYGKYGYGKYGYGKYGYGYGYGYGEKKD